VKEITIEVPKLNYHVEEAYKSLRTNLLFCGSDKKVIDITSCTEDEGKSTVARLLAISLAQTGKNVVLVDADMRKSVLTRAVRIQGHQKVNGLSLYLSGQVFINDILYKTNINGFYMIFTGQFPPNPAELLCTERFSLMVSSLRKAFDYVIIDTPPLGVVTDSAMVANDCDGAILVVESGAIGYPFAQDVVGQLRKADCPILGAVLNKVDIRSGSKYYGKYGGYGKYGKYGGYGHYYGYGKEGSSDATDGRKDSGGKGVNSSVDQIEL